MEESRGRRRWWLPIVLGVIVLGLSAALGYGLAQLVTTVASAPVPDVTLPPETATPASAESERASASPERGESPSATSEEPSPSASQLIHVVAEGEFLTRIAERYGVTVRAIIEANDISNPDLVEVGQRLIIPGGTAPSESAEASPS